MPTPHHPPLWALGLKGAGWHPAAARASTIAPREVFTAEYWRRQIGAADRAGMGLLSIDRTFALQTARPTAEKGRPDQILGRFDAVRLATSALPAVTHAGLLPQLELGVDDALPVTDAVVELVRNAPGPVGITLEVPDSTSLPRTSDLLCRWADEVEVRAGVGRRPVVAMSAPTAAAQRLAARCADIVFTSASTPTETAILTERLREQASRNQNPPALRVVADLLVVLDDEPAAAVRRWTDWTSGYGRLACTEIPAHLGSPETLLTELASWLDSGIDGVRFRVGSAERDLPVLLDEVLSVLVASARSGGRSPWLTPGYWLTGEAASV